MRKRYIVVPLVAVALAIPAQAVEANKSSQIEVCPDGQQLGGFDAGGFQAAQKPPPPGMHYTDEVSGDGPNYRVRSDSDSARLDGDQVPFEVVCK